MGSHAHRSNTVQAAEACLSEPLNVLLRLGLWQMRVSTQLRLTLDWWW